MARGQFITFEGGEGSGKSTQARLLAEALRDAGRAVVLTREPGGTAGAEAIRALLVTGETDRWTAWSEACLVVAARADHAARVIGPALARGDWVVCDRFVDSTRAYQGAGKGIADADLLTLHRMAVGDLWPDRTYVLTLGVEQGLARAAERAGSETRFEGHDAAFHGRVAAFFGGLAAVDPGRCRDFDGARGIAAIAAAIAADALTC